MKRQMSWVLALLAAAFPPVWARFELASVYSSQGVGGHYICGLPAMAIIMLASMGTIVLSSAAVVVGLIAFRAVPSPRPPARVAELVLLAVPLMLGGAYLWLMVFGG